MTTSELAATSVFVFLEHGLSLESWRADGSATRNASSPYGYAAAADAVRLSWSVDHPESRSRRLARRAVFRLLGFDLVHAWRNRAALAAADVVWTHTENESLAALALLRVTRNRRTRVIAQSVWIWDDWSSLSRMRRWNHLRLLRRASVELTLSPLNRDLAREVRGTTAVYTLPFGAAVNEGVAEQSRKDTVAASGGYVLAIGSDRHRDWATLIAAARLLPDVRFQVATLSRRFPAADAPPNVTVTPAASLEDAYRFYIGARMVLLPLLPNLHASGCTVAVEAQALDVPLVTTDVGGISTYLGDGVHLYEAEDPTSLVTAIGAAEATVRRPDGAGADFLRRSGLTPEDYAARYLAITRWVVQGGEFPAHVENLHPVRQILDQAR